MRLPMEFSAPLKACNQLRKITQRPIAKALGFALALAGDFYDALRDQFPGFVRATRDVKGRANIIEHVRHGLCRLGFENGFAVMHCDHRALPYRIQAGARSVSQPPTPEGYAAAGDNKSCAQKRDLASLVLCGRKCGQSQNHSAPASQPTRSPTREGKGASIRGFAANHRCMGVGF